MEVALEGKMEEKTGAAMVELLNQTCLDLVEEIRQLKSENLRLKRKAKARDRRSGRKPSPTLG